MKPALALLALLLAASAVAAAQVPPAETGPGGLPVSGTLICNLRYSQTAEIDGSLDGQQRSYASAEATYANLSKRLPFSMRYGGGYGKVWAGPPSAGDVYQHLMFSQGWIGRAWSLTGSENASYTFETPTTGFSGVPGSGEPIGGSGSPNQPDQTVLALNTRVFDNTASVAFGERLNGATTLSASGATGQIHFIDKNGLNTDTLLAEAGITRRLDARDSVSSQYSISHYSYSSTGFSTLTNTVQFSMTRQWSRRLSTAASAGPLWIASSGTSSASGLAVPDSTMLSLNASALYQLRRGSANVSYFHGTAGGSGYMLGSKIDSVNAGYTRDFGRSLTVGVTGSYTRSDSLIGNEILGICTNGSGSSFSCLLQVDYTPVSNARYGGAQATRKLGRYLNVFANYTVFDQSANLQINAQISGGGTTSTGSANANILNGLTQVIGFGIAYAPREIHLRK
ncbi:MAG: hypothetical protein ABR991_07215 [Terracidiphilus sp.]|jgi:hypothetical protein